MCNDIYNYLKENFNIETDYKFKRDYIKNPLSNKIKNKNNQYIWELPEKEDIDYLYNTMNLSIKELSKLFSIKESKISKIIKKYQIYKDKKLWYKKLCEIKYKKYGNSTYSNKNKANITKEIKYGKFKYKKYEKNPIQKKIYGEKIYNIISSKQELMNYIIKNNFYNRVILSNSIGLKRKALERLIKKYSLYNILPPKQTNEEIYILNKLKEKFPDTIHHYKSNLYQFNCDFYIPKLDLYIEYQGFWTHGDEPYIGTKEQKEKVKIWESKNTPQYKKAINEWTNRDPLKREIAKRNGLKWIEFFNMKQFMEWYDKQLSQKIVL